MSLTAAAMMYVAVGASGGALAFLTGQKLSGRTSDDVQGCYETVTLLNAVARDLHALREEAERLAPGVAREELLRACERLEDATSGLQRGADLVV